MGQLSEPQSAQQLQTAVTDRENAESALQTSPGDRSDTSSNQLPGAERAEFNPANDAGGSQGGSSGVASLPQQGGQEWESVLDVAKQYGHDTTGYEDDRTFLNALLQNAQRRQQEDYYSQLGRQLAPQHENIQKFIAQQKQPQAPAGPQPWEAPQFNRQWLGMVEYDPASGMYLGKPGAPQNIVDSVNAYQQWQEKFSANPMNVIKPWADQQIPQIVQQQVQQALGQYRKEQQVNTIVQANSDWMYQKDAAGNFVVGQGGRYQPTPNGLRYGQYINELERAGITDPHLADSYARSRLMADLSAHQQSQSSNQSPAAQRQNAMASGRQQQNVRQSQGVLERPSNEPDPDMAGMSLHDRIAANLDSAGFGTTADFRFDEMGG